MPRTPDPETWRAERVSQGFVADYKPFVMVDGEGVRCSLYVSGCLFACEGCFNEAAWSFRYGRPYDETLEERILADLAQPYVQGLSLLGGEPFLNTGVCLRLVRRLRAAHGRGRDVWCWTGYTFEELLAETADVSAADGADIPAYGSTAPGSADKRALLAELDVLVDGRFELASKNLTLQFRGSANQRILDVPASLAAGRAVPWARAADPPRGYERVERPPSA